jgi:hypothetical protein
MLLRLMLILAIAASGFSVGESASAGSANADQHACCAKSDAAGHDQKDDKNHHEDCGGACLMVCCRSVTAPADPVATPLDQSPLAVRIILPPLHANDLGEPQSIFHPPRA